MKTAGAGVESPTVPPETEDELAERRSGVCVPFPAPVDKTQAMVFPPSGSPQGVGGSMAWNPSPTYRQKQDLKLRVESYG